MSSRLKRNCKMCKKRSNLAFDPEKLLCPDCLILWRDNVVKEHKAGKVTFQDAYDSILKRCRMTEQEVLDLVFPPIGPDDFQSDSMALKMNFDIDVIKQLEEKRMSETGKIEKEDGSTVWIANDGREYKSKSGMWKRNKKLESESAGNISDEAKKAEDVSHASKSPADDSPSEPKVEWTEMDFGDEPITEVVPAPLKRISPEARQAASRRKSNWRQSVR